MQSGQDGGNVYAYYDGADIDEIERKLNGIKRNTPVDLAWASNQTMKYAVRALKHTVKERYRYHGYRGNSTPGFGERKANARSPVATITVKGEPLGIRSFTATHAKSGVGVAQLRESSPKRLEVDGRKAFWATMKNPKGSSGESRDYVGVFQRKSKNRFPIRKIFGSSVPIMIGGGQGVYHALEPQLAAKLREYTQRRIEYRLRMASR